MPHEAVAAIRVCGLSKTYRSNTGDVVALGNIDFEMAQGSRLCLLGPSGAGKTTLLHICASFETPSSGSVLLFGEPLRQLAPPVRLGVVQQRDSLFPNLTALGNVEFATQNRQPKHLLAGQQHSLKGRREARSEAEYWIERVGLRDFGSKWPRELSGGMRRRVELARALAYKPQILMMDEPCSSLDILNREEMQLLVLELCTDLRCSLLFATHDVEEALFVGEQIAVLSHAPAMIAARFDVPFPGPRAAELRMSAPFQELRAEVTARLKREASTMAMENRP